MYKEIHTNPFNLIFSNLESRKKIEIKNNYIGKKIFYNDYNVNSKIYIQILSNYITKIIFLLYIVFFSMISFSLLSLRYF